LSIDIRNNYFKNIKTILVYKVLLVFHPINSVNAEITPVNGESGATVQQFKGSTAKLYMRSKINTIFAL
jgi:hypothetical protein